MSFEYIARYYRRRGRRGTVIQFEGRPARVLSATHYLHVRFLDDKRPKEGYLHPTWHVTWPAEAVLTDA